MEVVKVLQKGQIVIPKDMREDLNIKEGNRLIIERINGSGMITISPLLNWSTKRKNLK